MWSIFCADSLQAHALPISGHFSLPEALSCTYRMSPAWWSFTLVMVYNKVKWLFKTRQNSLEVSNPEISPWSTITENVFTEHCRSDCAHCGLQCPGHRGSSDWQDCHRQWGLDLHRHPQVREHKRNTGSSASIKWRRLQVVLGVSFWLA